MHRSLILLRVFKFVFPALADRGSATVITPSICNSVPTDTSTPSPRSASSCEHEADPDGGLGLCSDLADGGWCDCGSAGDYPILTGSDICGYTSLDPSSQISLTSTDCSTSIQTLTVTVSPIPVSSAAKRTEPTFVPARRGVSRPAKPLNKRGGQVSFAASCDNPPPPSSSYKVFKTMSEALQQAYTDAVTMATLAQTVASDNNGFTLLWWN
ncbi:hypothetical protein EV356DRAFT_514466 [Viridothelium virens]|uniref:Uncharacterized protein n=1 Tax=Viridothelium virens TaxID=1048519 RepID=A0A6A6HB67_VIRVR|nr:hypothetical protein EV356DRAFT_514466 [Viridothelium virens]